MTALLRLVAVSIGVFVVLPLLFLAVHLGEVMFTHPSSPRSLWGAVALAGFLAAGALGAFATYRLWQLRHAGRRAAAAVIVMVLALQVVAALSGFPGPTAGVLVSATLLLLLFLPSVRAVCK